MKFHDCTISSSSFVLLHSLGFCLISKLISCWVEHSTVETCYSFVLVWLNCLLLLQLLYWYDWTVYCYYSSCIGMIVATTAPVLVWLYCCFDHEMLRCYKLELLHYLACIVMKVLLLVASILNWCVVDGLELFHCLQAWIGVLFIQAWVAWLFPTVFMWVMLSTLSSSHLIISYLSCHSIISFKKNLFISTFRSLLHFHTFWDFAVSILISTNSDRNFLYFCSKNSWPSANFVFSLLLTWFHCK